MKKTYLFLLGVLGLMASSCEEKIEPALPQQNPQQPIVAVEDVTSAKAGVLASDAVLNSCLLQDNLFGRWRQGECNKIDFRRQKG